MPLITWELWLARDIVNDNPLPGAEVSRAIDPWKSCDRRWAEFLRRLVLLPNHPNRAESLQAGYQEKLAYVKTAFLQLKRQQILLAKNHL